MTEKTIVVGVVIGTIAAGEMTPETVIGNEEMNLLTLEEKVEETIVAIVPHAKDL